ncbi:403_t:CDS:2 [Acaulospora morrowiae]|uniref:403_t:CDS:1 n=1 Tax=Acaulospora morrowiae TaxID=94023 RepID=A0A9N9F5H1_9GLOM|nr:403_t:CDS:2 [Acaulospora morrowiae]
MNAPKRFSKCKPVTNNLTVHLVNGGTLGHDRIDELVSYSLRSSRLYNRNKLRPE